VNVVEPPANARNATLSDRDGCFGFRAPDTGGYA